MCIYFINLLNDLINQLVCNIVIIKINFNCFNKLQKSYLITIVIRLVHNKLNLLQKDPLFFYH